MNDSEDTIGVAKGVATAVATSVGNDDVARWSYPKSMSTVEYRSHWVCGEDMPRKALDVGRVNGTDNNYIFSSKVIIMSFKNNNVFIIYINNNYIIVRNILFYLMINNIYYILLRKI